MRKVAYNFVIEIYDKLYDEGIVIFEIGDDEIYGEGLLTVDFITISEEDEFMSFKIWEKKFLDRENVYVLSDVFYIPKECFEIPLDLICGNEENETIKFNIFQKLPRKDFLEFKEELDVIKAESFFFVPE